MFNIVTDINGKREVVRTFNDYFEANDYIDYIYGNMDIVVARRYWIEEV